VSSPLILPPSYDTRPEVTTERHSHVGRKGDLVIELHTGDFGQPHGRCPALFIYHLQPERGCYVLLPEMWKFAEKDALHTLIPPIAERLYGFVTRDDLVRILDAILDYLDDLRKAPPAPKFKHKSLDEFMESCAAEGLDFFVDVNGSRKVG
jgi:hypothetical protein